MHQKTGCKLHKDSVPNPIFPSAGASVPMEHVLHPVKEWESQRPPKVKDPSSSYLQRGTGHKCIAMHLLLSY